jgi:hypothetical protein
MMCGISAPEKIGRCVLTAGHRGLHWNAGGSWGTRPPPPRKAHGSSPMHGTIEDVRALQDAIRVLAHGLVTDGVPLPPLPEELRRG